MDFLSEVGGRRRINLGGAASSQQTRADAVEAARKERERRRTDKQREQAASKIQRWYRARRLHASERARQRTLWDAELLQLAQAAQAGGVGVSARALQTSVARFMLFARVAPRHSWDAAVPPARQSAAGAALTAADLTRFRHLTKLLLANMRSADRAQHFGAALLIDPARWLQQSRQLMQLLATHVGDCAGVSIESASSEILLLWHLLDSAQWPFVKSAGQATDAEKARIQQVQSTLVAGAVTGAHPLLDLFRCLRARILQLTLIDNDGQVSSAQQLQHKTSVALMFATLLKAVTLSVQASPPLSAVALERVMASFVFHILSIPALAQRLRAMVLAALLPGFLAPTVFDNAMDSVTREVQRLLTHAPPAALSFAPETFRSLSYSAFDTASAVPTAAATAPMRQAMDVSSPASAASSSSASSFSAAASSSSAVASASSVGDAPAPLSGVAWLLGNCLDLASLLDESKGEAASVSFSHFLAACEQLIQAIPEDELPALGGIAMGAVDRRALPPIFIRQCALLAERSFLERLCRRLMTTEASLAAANTDASSASSSASPALPASSTPSAALNDVPIVCVLIDSILFKWGASSNAILNTLVFSSGIVKPLWHAIQRSGLPARIEAAGLVPVMQSMIASASASSSSSSSTVAASASSVTPAVHPLENLFARDRFFHLLPLFCTLYGHLLLISDDAEFFDQQKPFRLAEDVTPMVSLLKVLLYHLYWSNYSAVGPHARLRERFSKLFVQLRDRQSRRPFMVPEQWLFTSSSNSIPIATVQSELSAEEAAREAMGSEMESLVPLGRSAALVSSIPFVLPFSDRVKLLYAYVDLDKIKLRQGGVQFDHGLGRHVRIRRATVVEDGFAALSGLTSEQLKGRIQVNFVDEHGLDEAGLDGGGLWKEFLTTLMARAFDPMLGLWTTTHEHFIFPNPAALDLPPPAPEDGMGDDEGPVDPVQSTLQYFRFLGAMVGKALYDGIQIEAQFALFFLRACVGLRNYLDDLRSMDAQIHSSLAQIKSMSDDAVADLGLTFAVDRHVLGITRSTELVPGGASLAVTGANKLRFVYLMSDYYLSKQLSRQVGAFQQGMWSVVPPDRLRMFAAEELRLLISGSPKVNLADLRAHTSYSSGYSADHELIRWFWATLDEFSESDLAALLRFVTSCSRAPLLGFAFLSPGFAIQRVQPDEREQNMPTAATCMNLLRLPRYTSRERLKEKLLYAIHTAAHGFGLT